MKNRRIRVLLVEDDEDDYVITRDLLSEIGMRVELSWVNDYYDGLEAISRSEHDVYLFDYHLGDRNGLELLSEAVEMGCRAPIIMLTGQDDHDVDVEAMRIGAADYLVKGQTGVQLLERSIRYAVERSQMLEALRELAIRDELTGLYNRREMSRILSEEVDRCNRYKSPMTFILMDIDHFKKVNDEYGHQVGDAIVQWVAQLLRGSLRTTDKPARYGGDELAVILPETSREHALVVAERLRKKIANSAVTVADSNRQPLDVTITVSVGVASVPEDANNEENLVAAADAALYEAKRSGRNCTVRYSTIGELEQILG